MCEQRTILLIEDEARLRRNLQILLQNEGYRVVTAEHGEEGLQRLQADTFDLVITDLIMPKMDGFEVMEYLQRHFPDTVVVAITAYASTESAIQALRRGAYDYIAKPFDTDLLQIVIKRALEKARLQKALGQYMSELEQRVEERTYELTAAKNRLERSLADLQAAQEQLIQTARLYAMGEATTAMANELADPLTIIVSLAQVMAKEATAQGRMKTQLTQISEAALSCQQLMQSLLNFVEAKASLNSMANHVNLSHILLPGRSNEKHPKRMANLR
ncbi:MAG TPA: response regulator [Candidatus Tectomicrobia bacterium]|nr:response regulator [Candidatus Tectomicrobia bacterium]